MIANTGILQKITYSETRTDILLVVSSAPRTFEEIKIGVNRGAPEISKQLKDLVKSRLITKEEDLYYITRMGGVIVSHYKPLLDVIESYEKNNVIWDNHDLSAIPDELLLRVNELKDCTVIEADDCDLCESHKQFEENISRANHVYGAACIFMRGWIETFTELANNNIPIEIIVSKGVYAKLKREYNFELLNLLNHNAKIYICNHLNASFAVTDNFFSLSLNYNNGTHDTKHDLEGNDPYSVNWGEALFEYYLENSIQVELAESPNETIMQKIYPQSLLI